MPIREMTRNFAKASTSTRQGKLTTAQQLKELGIVIAPDARPDSLALQTQLIALSRVIRYTGVANVNNVLANIELAAFGNAWFMNEHWGDAEDPKSLKAVMEA
jgi:hypothetical protein